ncbi:ABC transporter permease [Actinomadura sp. 9N407]|uniref:ABC transporter permease n=1 Tax=Actinomadura sp. 9N407 TaxID=3375154 RepID=UPI0037B0F393
MLLNFAKRLGELALVLFIVSIGTFALVDLMPGDPAVVVLGEGHTAAEYDAQRDKMGLNDPFPVRYGEWVGSALTGDLGDSFLPPYSDVAERIGAALPVSVQLALMALFMALVIAIPLAMWSAYHAGGRVDQLVSAGTFGILSVPSFLAGMLLIGVFANGLGWFPRLEWARITDGLGANLHHAFLPALTIALVEIATFARVLRGDLITTLREDFILAARAKGMSPLHVLVRDALRPSSFSLITLLGISMGRLVGSTVIVEFLFALPGMGSLIIGSADQGDVPMVQGAVLVIALLYVLVNALIDLSYGRLDPRIRRAHV